MLIGKSYEGVMTNKDKLDRGPYARELIIIHLALFRNEVERNMGKPIPVTHENVDMISMTRGLYHYNEENELEQQIRPNTKSIGLTKIVEHPQALKT